MATKEPMTGAEGMRIIGEMIAVAKQEQKDDGLGWIFWGWLLFLASVLSGINAISHWFRPFFFWNVFGLVSLLMMLGMMIRASRQQDRQKARTYVKTLFDKLNVGFFVFLLMLIVAMNTGLPAIIGFGLLLGLYGFWSLIYGTLFNFTPSVAGAFLLWICGFASLFVSDFSWTMFLHAVGVLLGYIVPGHRAYLNFNRYADNGAV